LRGRFQSAQKPSADGRPVRRMNSASRGLRPTVDLCRPGGGFASAEADAWRASALRGRFQSAQKPSANGRPARRMNSASRGLRPAVSLRRPKSVPCVGGGRRLARGVPNEFGLERPSADGRPVPTEKRSLRRRRPTPGAERLEGSISIGTKAFGRRSACADREGVLRRRRPTHGAERLERPISIGTKAFGQRLACADREGVLCVGGGRRLARSALRGRFQLAQKPSADGRPAPTEKHHLRRRRPTPGAERLEGPISIGTKAFGRRSACADREGVLRRRRPTPGAQAP